MSERDRKKIYSELLRPARVNYPRREIRIKGLRDLFVTDLIDMTEHVKENDGYRYILLCMNGFSKYVFVQPLRRKTTVEVTDAFEKILKRTTYLPKNLQSDQGGEYQSQYFNKLMKKYKINFYHTGSDTKCSLAERVIRTIKGLMYKDFASRGNYNWIDHIDKIVRQYNNNYHQKIHTSPRKVSEKNEKQILRDYYTREFFINKEPKFKVEDHVRLSRYKSVFEKSYRSNWSYEIFTVHKVLNTYPPSYILKYYKGNILHGCSYEPEMSLTKYPHTYLVEKVLKTKNNLQLVKWLGFSDKENSWIPKNP